MCTFYQSKILLGDVESDDQNKSYLAIDFLFFFKCFPPALVFCLLCQEVLSLSSQFSARCHLLKVSQVNIQTNKVMPCAD